MKSTVAWCAGSCRIGWLFRVTLAVLGLSGPATDCFPGILRKAKSDKGGLTHFLPSLTKKQVLHPSTRRVSGLNRLNTSLGSVRLCMSNG